MPRICTLAIAMAALGVLSSVPVTGARACDNDRYPCPIVSQTQDTVAAPPAPSRKKASRAAQQDEKPRAKPEGEVSRTSSRPTKANPPPAQEQASVSSPQKSEDPASAVAREEAPVAAANAGAGARATGGGEAPPVAAANEVRVVDPNELNELDLAAANAVAAGAAGAAGSSWLSYLLMTLGGALAAASTVRFLFFV
jgi:outer membrane biosynthesis protein TonB